MNLENLIQKKPDTEWFWLYGMHAEDKSLETDKKEWLPGAGGEEKQKLPAKGHEVYLLGW